VGVRVNNDVWLAGVVGVAGLVLIAMVVVVLRVVNQSRRSRPGSGETDGSEPLTPVAYAARGLGHMFGAVNAPHRVRSVEDNLQRAFARIDTIDPYAGQRRIGMALTDVGLLDGAPDASEAPAAPEAPAEDRPRTPWPFDSRPPERDRREDDQ